jgi:hypothetical protein
MYTSHSMWLIVVGVVLLLAMVGAISITLSQSPDTKGEGLVNKPLRTSSYLSRNKTNYSKVAKGQTLFKWAEKRCISASVSAR